jgi:hypothetical protein
VWKIFSSYLAEGVPQRKAVKKLSNIISAYLLSLLFSAVLPIRDVYPGSRIRIRTKEFKYFNPKIVSKLSEI